MLRVIHTAQGAEQELEVRINRPEAALSDLADALGAPGSMVALNGRVLPPETGVHESGLVNGARISISGALESGPRRPAVVLRLVGGLEAGRSVPLTAGTTVIGRGGEADVRVEATGVSRLHAALEVTADGQVTVTDLDSVNGTDVNGQRISQPECLTPEDLVSLGGEVLLRVLPPDRLGAVQHINTAREAGPGGTLPFNRVPRSGRRDAPPALKAPAPLSKTHKAPFSISSMLGPLLMAGAIVAITRDLRYAAIAALTPLMFLTNFVEERVRGRHSLRRSKREHAARIAEFRTAVTAAHADETRQRRAAFPDPADVAYWAQAPALTLWERRPGAPDFMKGAVGSAGLPWTPALERNSAGVADEVAGIVSGAGPLPQVPVVVGTAAGEAVGFEGDRRGCLAVARSLLCQAVVGSGPADVTVAVFTDPERLPDWDWTKWLPHGADARSGTERLVAVGPEQTEALARNLLGTGPATAGPGGGPGGAQDGPVLLVVVDGATLLEGRPNRLRNLLTGVSVRCAGLVLTDRLPALCTSVVTAVGEGTGQVRDIASGAVVPQVLLHGLPEPVARQTARSLARFEDPELRTDGAGLPDRISLLPLLDLEEASGDAVAKYWAKRVADRRVRAVLGVSERDLFTADLDDDGPHALIAGTTGSGKSELLRTLIASMAVDADPEHLTFVLVDYKGGGALDECAALPHVTGLVTDLDKQLSQRAMRCLEAELHHRERLLRQVGLSHVREYQRLRDTGRADLEPMPRLAVVIDEFATLVQDVPDFVDSLVSIAQRGRSLGVHLVMATQRPAGSVSDAIKNNVKLRIALRLESTGDSHDVIDNAAAAGIGTRQWGRAYYRLSAREVLPVQTALSTGVTPQAEVTAPVTVAPFLMGVTSPEPATGKGGLTDLQRLVAAAQKAAALSGFAEPRHPWPDPLPPMVPAADLPPVAERGLHTATAGLPAYALADDPDRQCQYPVGWDPAAGNVLVYGGGGTGTSTALVALALSWARTVPPGRLHLFVLDLGAAGLAPLAGLPHTGAHIKAAEGERQLRLIKLLRRELDRRKTEGSANTPDWLVLLDNLGALLADFDRDVAGMNLMDELTRVYADGPPVGIRFAVSADRSGAVPTAWSGVTQTKLLMRLADTNDYSSFDVPAAAVPTAISGRTTASESDGGSCHVPGRALVTANRQIIQIAWPGEDLTAAVETTASQWPGAPRSAPEVGLLPAQVPVAALTVPVSAATDPWWIPVGLDADTLGCAGLQLHEGEHALIAGPQRSGRSTALCSIARSVATAYTPPNVVALTPRRSPLRGLQGADVVQIEAYGALEATLSGMVGPTLLLVDDADTIDDELGVLERWLSGRAPGSHLVAAGRADAVRRLFAHWTQPARESRCGILLCPDHDLDGDLLGTELPRYDRMTALPGRGYLVTDGVAGGVQVAM